MKFLLSLILLLGALTAPLAAEDAPRLQADDCAKCHTTQLADIAAKGGRHRDAVSCVDCHREHPPRGANAIPQCSLCHEPAMKSHFTAPDCLGCHRPHAPREIEFSRAKRVRPACLSCHAQPGEEMADYPSNHAVLDCKECHRQHGRYLECLECHEPHLAGQSYFNCRQCHRPHMPLKVSYDNTISVESCGACHPGPAALLAENRTKHHQFLCVYCHKFQHKVIPKCITCHGEPHFPELHEKFKECISCHVGPHNLLI